MHGRLSDPVSYPHASCSHFLSRRLKAVGDTSSGCWAQLTRGWCRCERGILALRRHQLPEATGPSLGRGERRQGSAGRWASSSAATDPAVACQYSPLDAVPDQRELILRPVRASELYLPRRLGIHGSHAAEPTARRGPEVQMSAFAIPWRIALAHIAAPVLGQPAVQRHVPSWRTPITARIAAFRRSTMPRIERRPRHWCPSRTRAWPSGR